MNRPISELASYFALNKRFDVEIPSPEILANILGPNIRIMVNQAFAHGVVTNQTYFFHQILIVDEKNVLFYINDGPINAEGCVVMVSMRKLKKDLPNIYSYLGNYVFKFGLERGTITLQIGTVVVKLGDM